MNPFSDPKRSEILTEAFRLTLPEITLVAAACLLFLLGLFIRNRWMNWFLAVAALVGAAVLAVVSYSNDLAQWNLTPVVAAGMPILPTPVSMYVRWGAILSGFIYLLVCTKEMGKEHSSEYLACVLVMLAGASLVASANDLVSLYLALEMISIPTYILLILPEQNKTGSESTVKYFTLSILSSAFLLFGFSYLYGVAGSTNLSALQSVLRYENLARESPLVGFAIVMLVVGLGFKITAVPFHFYAPDVYQGGPTGVVSLLAVVPKIAGFVALARILGFTTAPLVESAFRSETSVPMLFFLLALVTMTLGNVLALLQDNLKRMIAYSGVAHSGYLLLGFVTTLAYISAETRTLNYINGWDATLFYLVAYAFMTIGFFAVIAHLQTPERPIESFDDLAGLGQTNPVAALLMSISLLSLIGFPLTAGFAGKFLLFMGLYSASNGTPSGSQYGILTAIAAVNAAIGAVYYLRLISVMYLRSPLRTVEPTRCSGPFLAAILCTIGTLVFGIYPKLLTDFTREAAPLMGAKPLVLKP